jgi:competence protein ComGC
MSFNERGFSVYTVISVILFLALVFILALPNFFNLDKAKNEEDCINNMKLIWVAATDYMKDNLISFDGNLETLRTTYKKTADVEDAKGSVKRSHYLEKKLTCPENRGNKEDYIVFSKLVIEDVQGTRKLNYGTIVVCPNLARYPKHIIPKSFYENMEPTEIQNYFIDDLDAIEMETGSDGYRKLNLIKQYIEIWKTDQTALSRIRENNLAIRNQVMPPPAPETPEM